MPSTQRELNPQPYDDETCAALLRAHFCSTQKTKWLHLKKSLFDSCGKVLLRLYSIFIHRYKETLGRKIKRLPSLLIHIQGRRQS